MATRKRRQNEVQISGDVTVTERFQVGIGMQGYRSERNGLSGYPPLIDVEMEDAMPLLDAYQNICYGALCDAKAQFNFRERLTISSRPWSRFHSFKLVGREEYYYLVQINELATDEIGMLDLITTKYLHSVRRFSELSFIAVIDSSSLNRILKKPTRKDIILDISINIIGPERICDTVGETLAQASAYLQHPIFLQTGIGYINPQYFYPGNNKTDLRHLIGPAITNPRSVHISEGVEKLLQSLDDLSHPAAVTGLQAISAAMQDGLILTPLKRHQEDGVSFILNREDPTFCDSVMSDLKALVGSRFFSENPPLCLGGVVADVMGLGKTLTMLSAMVCSKSAATQFTETNTSRTTLRLTRATLIVVTSRQVLDVWTSEIEKHLKPNTLKIAIFHGENRVKTTDGLVDHDVVLTTYRTLASDWKGRRVLQDIGWFRVALDEAHWIRNQATEQFKAAEGLQAERRWCLTGTPIQNSLDDLRSLLRFLHFQPFASQKFFDKHIIEPLQMSYYDSFRNLKLLLQTLCLRRNAGYLHLPPADTEEITIALASEEKAAYERVLADCQAELDNLVNTASEAKKCCILFSTISKLRRVCNQGSFQTTSAVSSKISRKRRKIENRDISPVEELFCEFCSGTDGDAAGLLTGGLDICPECSRYLEGQETPLSQPSMDRLSLNSPSGFLAPSTPMSRSPTPQLLSPVSPGFSFQLKSGHSSKLVAVADNIQKSLQDPNNDSKSLVFTSWVATLDILASMLTERRIPWLQIDGRVSFSDRAEILSKFRQDPNIPVLLMTFQTGAVGLTLTVANRVHIIEPQWNPTVEEQAIARVLRMGQTRPVTIIKYITEKTIEQNILDLQKKKSSLAKFALEGGTGNNTTGKLDDLKFVLDTGS